MPDIISDTHLNGNEILSKHEVEVLALSADGHSNKQHKLHISIYTITTQQLYSCKTKG